MESNKYIITRVILVYAFVFLFGLTIIGKVAVIQFKQGAYWKERAQTLTTQEFVVDASRGNIYDSNMNLLATSLPFYEVGIDANTDYLENLSAEEFSKEMDSLSICLAQVGKQKSKREYYLMLMKARANGDRYLPLLKEVSYNELQKIKQFPVCRLGRNKGGFVFNQNNKRERPFQELAARTIHQLSSRANGPFIAVNAATITPERMEIELFGVDHSNGSEVRKGGALEEAHGGTLFFDDVADLPRETQNKILRVLVDQNFQRVGGATRVHVP